MAAWTVIIRAYVIFVLVIASGIPVVQMKKKHERSVLHYSDCGNEDKLINFHHLDATPLPIIIPGTLYVTMSGNLTSDLPRRVNIYLGITKYFFGFPFHVPCLGNGIGSCTYENICASLDKYVSTGCPRALRNYGFPCHCPFVAGQFSITQVPVNIPKVNRFARALVNGDYALEMRISEEDGMELGCLRVKFSMKKRNRGWLFKI